MALDEGAIALGIFAVLPLVQQAGLETATQATTAKRLMEVSSLTLATVQCWNRPEFPLSGAV